ncbi:GFA family protein [Novosphingobium sp. PS1R-30]|uniref:GFA family protein n=1 Tax=Novosphingobium anseongense TaxID=3133436 RepID=A0ABU8RZU0_9SPHN
MGERVASCACGQLRAHCAGEPVRISVCHCLECQKRSGSSFAAQARWPEADVAITGTFDEWSRIGDEGNRATFRFCPRCGSTVAYVSEGLPGLVAIAIGAFADPLFPAPQYSVYEERKHAWVAVVGDGIEHYD